MRTAEKRKEYFLRKAKEAREQAAAAGDSWVRDALEDVARNYERLAAEEAQSVPAEVKLTKE